MTTEKSALLEPEKEWGYPLWCPGCGPMVASSSDLFARLFGSVMTVTLPWITQLQALVSKETHKAAC